MADKVADTDVTRTQYGAGSLYQRTSDWRWMGTVEAGSTMSGTRRRVTVTGVGCVGGCPARCKHRAAIKRKLADKHLEVKAARGRKVKRAVTVSKWAGEWLDKIATTVTPSGLQTDTAAMKALMPTLGDIKLDELEPSDVERAMKHLRAEGLSSSTLLRYHGPLMRMLKAASLQGYNIAPNVLLTDKPKKAANDREAIPPDQLMAVLATIAPRPDQSRWALAALQGLRPAEALGLTWSALDLDAQTLTISWQLQTLRYIDAKQPALGFKMPDGYEARQLRGAFHLVRPKSAAGWRVTPLTDWAAAALRTWRDVAPDSSLVWPGRVQKGVVWPRNAKHDREEWFAIQKAAGIAHSDGRPYHRHEIRHGTATLLLELGVPESVRVAIMGHSSVASTRTYEHVDLRLSREALNTLGERLGLGVPALPTGRARRAD